MLAFFSVLCLLTAMFMAAANPTAYPTGQPTHHVLLTPKIRYCPNGTPQGASVYPHNPDIFSRFEMKGFLEYCGGLPVPREIKSFQFNSSNILSYPLNGSINLVGYLSGENCPLNGYFWVRECFNNGSTVFNETFPYYIDPKLPVKNLSITVGPRQTVALPIGLPYSFDGVCPYGLFSVTALCEPYHIIVPTGYPTIAPHAPPTPSTCGTCKNSRSVTTTNSTTTSSTYSVNVTETTCLVWAGKPAVRGVQYMEGTWCIRWSCNFWRVPKRTLWIISCKHFKSNYSKTKSSVLCANLRGHA